MRLKMFAPGQLQGFAIAPVTFVSLVAIFGLLGPAPAFAAAPFSGLINFDYSFTEAGYAPYGPGPGAIGNAGDLWNASDVGNPTAPLSLIKSDGTPTTATWSVSTGGSAGGPVPGPYTWLFDINAS